jgi:hypothetical protein
MSDIHEKLTQLVERGRSRADSVVTRIRYEVPQDHIVALRSTRTYVSEDGALRLGFGEQDYLVHTNAIGQLASRCGVPIGYLRDLLVADVVDERARGELVVTESRAWRRQLAARILEAHTSAQSVRARVLVRSVGSQVRGILSDRFRRLDVRPLFDAFAEACAEVGAVPVDGTSTEVRVSVQAIVPKLYEPVPGDPIVLGLDWSNSDFGRAPYEIRVFTLRLLCANGLVGRSEMHQRHLGARLDDSIEWSARTLQSDTETMRLATQDVVRGALGPARVELFLESLRLAASQETNFESAIRRVSKELTKAERNAAASAFDGPDVVNLPAGNTLWRASNAISWIANAESVAAERRLELQELAGQLLPSS